MLFLQKISRDDAKKTKRLTEIQALTKGLPKESLRK